MHEYSLAQGVIAAVNAEKSGVAGRLKGVTLEVGELAGVNPAALRQALELLAPGSGLEGAAVVIRPVPARGWCPTCAAERPLDRGRFACPACGAAFRRVSGGREFNLVELDLEDPPGAADEN